MQILPDKIYKGFDGNGNPITLEEWDYTTFMGWQLAGNIALLIAGIFIGSILSPILLLLGIYGFNGRRYFLHIVGALISTYFLIDCYNAWIAMAVIRIFCEESTLNFLLAINSAALLGHLGLFLFGWTLQKKYGDKPSDLLAYVLGLAFACCFVGYTFSNAITHDHNGWVESNVHKDDPKNKYEGMTNEQIEAANNKEYEDQLRKEGRDPDVMKRYSNDN
jgi:hypothetical protein